MEGGSERCCGGKENVQDHFRLRGRVRPYFARLIFNYHLLMPFSDDFIPLVSAFENLMIFFRLMHAF